MSLHPVLANHEIERASTAPTVAAKGHRKRPIRKRIEPRIERPLMAGQRPSTQAPAGPPHTRDHISANEFETRYAGLAMCP